MFLPRFGYTPAITELLSEIELLRSRLADAATGDPGVSGLRSRVAARRAAGASALDGISITAEQAELVLSGRPANLPEGSLLTVRSYQFALERMAAAGGEHQKPFGAPLLMTLHFYLLYDPRQRKQVPGLRREAVALADVRDGSPLAFAPQPAALQPSLQELAGWLYASRNAVSPLLRAAIGHLRLLHLQPFSAANGRAACALADLMLLGGGFTVDTLPPVEAQHAANLDRYYAAAVSALDAEGATGDVTAWLEYYCAAVAEELRGIAGSLPAPQDPGPDRPPLNSRQRRILEILSQPGSALTNQECQQMFNVSPVTAARDFRDLVERGKVVLRGQGRGSYYTAR